MLCPLVIWAFPSWAAQPWGHGGRTPFGPPSLGMHCSLVRSPQRDEEPAPPHPAKPPQPEPQVQWTEEKDNGDAPREKGRSLGPFSRSWHGGCTVTEALGEVMSGARECAAGPAHHTLCHLGSPAVSRARLAGGWRALPGLGQARGCTGGTSAPAHAESCTAPTPGRSSDFRTPKGFPNSNSK